LEQVERQTGKTPEQLLSAPVLPDHLEYIWKYYTQLSGTRQNGMAINPINHQEILAWCQLHRIRLHSWEIFSIIGIDSAFIVSLHEEKPTTKK
jgi:hypothetical protein